MFWNIIHTPWNLLMQKIHFSDLSTICTELYNCHHYLILDPLHHCKREPCADYSHSSLPYQLPQVWAACSLLVSEQAYSGHFIILESHYEVLCDWLLPLSLTFSRFTHVVFLLLSNNISLYGYPTFCLCWVVSTSWLSC